MRLQVICIAIIDNTSTTFIKLNMRDAGVGYAATVILFLIWHQLLQQQLLEVCMYKAENHVVLAVKGIE